MYEEEGRWLFPAFVFHSTVMEKEQQMHRKHMESSLSLLGHVMGGNWQKTKLGEDFFLTLHLFKVAF